MSKHRAWRGAPVAGVALAMLVVGVLDADRSLAAEEPSTVAVAAAGVTGDRESAGSPDIDVSFEGPDMLDAWFETGEVSTPPHPMAAAGTDRIVAVTGKLIEAVSKTGTILWREPLLGFFGSGLSILGAPVREARVVYDPYEDRFVVSAFQLLYDYLGDPFNDSRILLAVSRNGTPSTGTAADWHLLQIDSNLTIEGAGYFAGAVRMELDEEAVYVLATLSTYALRDFVVASRLWILHKGAVGGWYAGEPATLTVHAPYDEIGSYDIGGLTPALIHDGGPDPDVGTFLVSYNGATAAVGGEEWLQVIRVDKPLTAPAFFQQWVGVGDIDFLFPEGGDYFCPDAPQPETTSKIRLFGYGCRAITDAVWRNDSLWVVTTVEPEVGPDAGQTTAHWFQLDTSALPGPIALKDQGDISGDEQAPGAFTFFPSVAVNAAGDAKFGFAASAPTLFVSAFVAGRREADPPGSLRPSQVVRTGTAPYRRFNDLWGTNPPNWGYTSGISTDPGDDDLFWNFNAFAHFDEAPGVGVGDWGTQYARCTIVDPPLLPVLAVVPDAIDFGPVPVSGIGAVSPGPTKGGGAGSVRTLRIRNVGGAGLTVEGVSQPGGDFALANAPASTQLGPLEFFDVDVVYVPGGVGHSSASLTVFGDAFQQNVDLLGEGFILGPPGVPDGTHHTQPLRVDKLEPFGFTLELSFDEQGCDATSHHVLYGGGSSLPAAPGAGFGVTGAECAIGSQAPYVWGQSPDAAGDLSGLLWFLVVATDGSGVEGPWGFGRDGEDRYALNSNDGASLMCGVSSRNLSNACGQPHRGIEPRQIEQDGLFILEEAPPYVRAP